MADAFIYNADMLCEDCGRETIDELIAEAIHDYARVWDGEQLDDSDPEQVAIALGFDPEDEETFDSDAFPKGPYANGGGEADSPQHCGRCRKFLENPLTGEGYRYVIQRVAHADGEPDVTAEWDAFYLDDCRARDLAFRPLRDGRVFRLQLFDLWETVDGKAQVAYIFGEAGKPAIFVGFEFGVPVGAGNAISSDWTARQLLGFITLRPGDTDREYFESYTPAQMAWTREYACEVMASYADEDAYHIAEELEDFEPISAVERLAGDNAHYPYLIVRNGLDGDDRRRPTFNRDDWSAGDWTFAEDTQTLHHTGSGKPLWRAAHKASED